MTPAPSQIKQQLLDRTTDLAEQIVELQYQKQPEFWKPYGSKGRALSVRDAGYHIPFLASAIELNDKGVFTDYVAWVKKLFQGLNFPDHVMITTLECTLHCIQQSFPDEMTNVIAPFIEAGIEQMKVPVKDAGTYIDVNEKLGQLALDFNQTLLKGDRKSAGNMIMQEVEKGTPIEDLYLYVFQKSQYEVGRLWLSNKISVAKEHFCSAATQQIMSMLYPYIFASEKNGHRMLAANVGNELHEIGIRMVADFFEMAGWDTYYLGANTPANIILKAIEDEEVELVGLSIAMPYHISVLKDAIEQIRQSFGNQIKVLIGGYALQYIGSQYQEFHADGYAVDAKAAVDMANHLIAV